MFLDPLVEKTVQSYYYTGNNPIMFTDPDWMSKDQGGDPYVKTLNRSVSDFFYIGINCNQLVNKE